MKLKQQEPWDNSGLQIGSYNADINNIMLTLDIDSNIIEYAINNKYDLIITHHPFIFSGMKSIDFSTYEGKLIKDIIINNLNIYSLHTNYDMASFGVNYQLSKILNINDFDILHIVNPDGSGYGGIGSIKAVNIVDYAKSIKELLKVEHIKLYCSRDDKIVNKVAFCGGSGGEFINDAIAKEADVYITGDIKYHQAQFALQNNLCIIDAGHYNTEYQSLENIKNILSEIDNINVKVMEINTVKEIFL